MTPSRGPGCETHINALEAVVVEKVVVVVETVVEAAEVEAAAVAVAIVVITKQQEKRNIKSSIDKGLLAK